VSPDDGQLLRRYLSLLGIEPAPPDGALLRRLTRAQLRRVPFENISKLYRVRCLGLSRLPTLAEHLDGIEHQHLGGTCYASNYYLCRLLRYLGFDADFCGADMVSGRDVHSVVLVRVAGREHLVDAGYGAPFFEPLPRDLAHDHALVWGNDRYVLAPPDAAGCSRLDHFRAGRLIHGYRARPEPRPLHHFDAVIRASYDPSATFMNALSLHRFFAGRSVSLYNHKLIEATASGAKITRLADRDAILAAIEQHFEIPPAILEPATAGLGPLQGVHG